MIKEVTYKLLNSQEVANLEIRESFEEIFSGLANEIQTTSFITALNGANLSDDIACVAIEASSQAIKKPFGVFLPANVIENNVLIENNNYINVPLLQDLICASADLNVSCYQFDDDFSKTNSFEILSLMGVNLLKEVDYSSAEFEKLNFNYFYLSSQSPYFKYTDSIKRALPFDNILNITSKMLNPLGAKNLFLGVSKNNLVEKFSNISLKLQKDNSIIVCGNDSLPFVAPSGESYIAEAWKNKIFSYSLNPQLLGFEEYELSQIICENNKQNALDILEIISNKKKDAKYAVAILNSALSLYISKKAESIIDGISFAKKLIEDGLVLRKFEQIKEFYS